jgi:hypothetical protein
MSDSVEFVKDRATKTLSAAKNLAAQWEWQDKSVAALEAEITAIIGDAAATPPVKGQEQIVSEAEQAMLAARGDWDAQLDILHGRTVQGVGMMKQRFRNDAAKLAVLAPLTASSNSRSETLEEALAWESAWTEVDPAWAPLPANSLAAFRELRAQCAGELKTAYSNARATWRAEAEKLSAMVADLNDDIQAWYADATRIFLGGTPEGDMLRGTIPTTYAPKEKAPATPPAPKPA